MSKLITTGWLSLALLLASAASYGIEPPPPAYTPPPTGYLAEHIPEAQTPIETGEGGAIGWLKYLPDGTQVQVAGKLVTAVFYGSPTTLYVQEADRSAGIRVLYEGSATVDVGNIVDLSGSLTTVDAQRVIEAAQISRYMESGAPVVVDVDPLVFTHKDLGGGAQGYQVAVMDNAPSDIPAVGVNSVGLLVRTWGTVTYVDPDPFPAYFYIDDGSELLDGSGKTGIRVSAVATPPAANALAEVTGIVSVALVNGKPARVLLPRTPADVVADLKQMPEYLESMNSATGGRVAGYDLWNALSLPRPPTAYPPSAQTITGRSSPDDVNGYLYAWDPISQAGVPKDSQTSLKAGTGYWLRLHGYNSFAYQGVKDDTTDRCVSVPYTAFNLIGHPLNADLYWKDLLISDGKRTVNITEGRHPLYWVSSIGYWYRSLDQSMYDIGVPDDYPSTEIMYPWQAYYFYAFKPVNIIFAAETRPTTARGSILATVTSQSGAPLVGARVSSKFGSAITQAPGGTALIENLPAGAYVVTASAARHKSKSSLVTVSSGSQAAVALQLESSGITVGVTASPERIPPDGTSISAITVFVADLEGMPLRDKDITLSSGGIGSLSATTGRTDESGKFQASLTSSTNPETATVAATCEGVSAYVWVEFANADAPSIRIVAPTDGAIVSGEVEIRIDYIDVGGTDPGILRVSIYADENRLSTFPGTAILLSWDSFKATNGQHTIRATAEDLDRNTVTSNLVRVVAQNSFSEFSISPDLVNVSEPVHISAQMALPGDWTVTVSDGDGNTVWQTTGTGANVSVDWPGTTNPGMYYISVSQSGSPPDAPTPTLPVGVNAAASPDVLLVAEDSSFSTWKKTMDRLERIVTARGLTCRKLTPGKAPWSQIRPILQSSGCSYFYFCGHGEWRRKGIPSVTHIFVDTPEADGCPVILYAHRWEGAPPSGSPDPLEPEYKIAYASDLGRTEDPFSLVWIDACFSGRVGASREGEEMYSEYSCYAYQPEPAWNDMASSFGVTPFNTLIVPCGYVGWYDWYWTGNGYGYVHPTSQGIVCITWDKLASGRTFDYARWWIDSTIEGRPCKSPEPDEPCKSIFASGKLLVAAFYNWRFWGTAFNPLFE